MSDWGMLCSAWSLSTNSNGVATAVTAPDLQLPSTSLLSSDFHQHPCSFPFVERPGNDHNDNSLSCFSTTTNGSYIDDESSSIATTSSFAGATGGQHAARNDAMDDASFLVNSTIQANPFDQFLVDIDEGGSSQTAAASTPAVTAVKSEPAVITSPAPVDTSQHMVRSIDVMSPTIIQTRSRKHKVNASVATSTPSASTSVVVATKNVQLSAPPKTRSATLGPTSLISRLRSIPMSTSVRLVTPASQATEQQYSGMQLRGAHHTPAAISVATNVAAADMIANRTRSARHMGHGGELVSASPAAKIAANVVATSPARSATSPSSSATSPRFAATSVPTWADLMSRVTGLDCPCCAKVFKSKRSLFGHIREIHMTDGTRQHGCQECGKSFVRKSNLKAHVESVHYGRKFACSECGNVFANRSALNQHNRRLHGASANAATTSGSTGARSSN